MSALEYPRKPGVVLHDLLYPWLIVSEKLRSDL